MPARQARFFLAGVIAYLSKVLECDTSLHGIGCFDKQQLMFPDLTQNTLIVSSCNPDSDFAASSPYHTKQTRSTPYTNNSGKKQPPHQVPF
jgi:hypothetical protein